MLGTRTSTRCLENLLDMVAEKLATEEGEMWFSSVDMTYAYGQVSLHQLLGKFCNLQFMGGESTGSYRFDFVICSMEYGVIGCWSNL